MITCAMIFMTYSFCNNILTVIYIIVTSIRYVNILAEKKLIACFIDLLLLLNTIYLFMKNANITAQIQLMLVFIITLNLNT